MKVSKLPKRKAVGMSKPAGPITGNIAVVVRVRPKTEAELAKGMGHTVELMSDKSTLIFDPADGTMDQSVMGMASGASQRQKNMAFSFDAVLGPEATQEHVYESTAKDLIAQLLDGFNASVIAYGQTSAGKTFTMLGNRIKGPGVMVRAMEELFAAIDADNAKRANSLDAAQATRTVEYSLTFSYLEVYNETIRDLLADSDSPAPAAGGLDLQDGTEGDVQVLGISEHKPQNVTDVMALLERGNSNRSQSETDANLSSSRSHAVLQVHVRRTERRTNGTTKKVKTIIRRSKLSMVDLAGSERAKATVSRGDKLRKEGQNINKSLLALGNCINALSSGSGHVPFRDSKLTRLLKDSLGGNCKTVMIANVSPCLSNYEDTYQTLNYAKRAKNIKVKLTKAQLAVATTSDNFNLAQIEALRDENERLREMLKLKTATSAPAGSSAESASQHSKKATNTTKLESQPLDLIDQKSMDQAMQAVGIIRKEAESLYSRKLSYHKQAFSAWVRCQWARVRVQLIERQLEEYHHGEEVDTLRASLEAAQAQQRMQEFDTATFRRQMAAVDEEIMEFRDEATGVWSAFSPALVGLRDAARSLIDIQSAKCDSEMLKRECNVMRLLVESGWDLQEDSVPPATPELNKTPVSLRLRAGSPGFRIPAKRLVFQNETTATASSGLSVSEKLSEATEGPISPTSESIAEQLYIRFDNPKMSSSASSSLTAPVEKPSVETPVKHIVETQTRPSPAMAQPQVEFEVTTPVLLEREQLVDSPVVKSAAKKEQEAITQSPLSETEGQKSPAMLRMNDEKPEEEEQENKSAEVTKVSNDEVPAAIRSFGSSLSMLSSALTSDEGLSNVSLSTLSLSNMSGDVSTTATDSMATSAPAARKSSSMSNRDNIRDRLKRLVRERVEAKRETADGPATPQSTDDSVSSKDVRNEGNTRSSSLESPHVESLAWSPVNVGSAADESIMGAHMSMTTNVSDLSLLMQDGGSKVSLSFAPEFGADESTTAEETYRILETRERKIGELKSDIKGMYNNLGPITPEKASTKRRSMRIKDKVAPAGSSEENVVNNASRIPRPSGNPSARARVRALREKK